MIPLPNLNLKKTSSTANNSQTYTSVDLSNPWTQVKNIQIHSTGSQAATARAKKETPANMKSGSGFGNIPTEYIFAGLLALWLLKRG